MMSAQLQQQQQPNGIVPSVATPPMPPPPEVKSDTPAPPETAIPNEQGAAAAALRNRALESNSPYVRRHAETPVAWQLLDADTLALAKAVNRPIFMHTGFHACHYCRLTTQDSFQNHSVAQILNESFVPVIVDREERPDLDTIYQNYSQATIATGGWPLNLLFTPDLYPIFGGTYWPGPGTEHARAGPNTSGGNGEEEKPSDFLGILKKLRQFWLEQEDRCRREAVEGLAQLQAFAAEGTFGASNSSTAPAAARHAGASLASSPIHHFAASCMRSNGDLGLSAIPASESDLDIDVLEEAVAKIAKAFDPANCGFGTPKFPTPARLSFLLRLAEFPSVVRDVVGQNEVEHATHMAVGTLRNIRDRGLRDHAGAGFMRYSQTSDWSMPHFEKMVGDNALLLGVYLDAMLASLKTTGKDDDPEFADVVIELADYLINPLICLESGGFVTSEAADSFYRRGDQHVREGAYYLWTRREFDVVVGGDASDGEHASAVAAAHWNVLEHGNVARNQDPHDEFINQNVLCIVKDVGELSRQFGIPVPEVKRIISSAKEKLKAYREKERVRPAIDDKIVVSVNGMVIAVLARTAAAVPGMDRERSDKYLAAAKKAATFLKEKLWARADDSRQASLYRFFYNGPSKTRAFADDYAFLIEGVLDLYEATLEEEWLTWAKELQDTQTALFYDHPQPGATPSPRRSYSGGFYSTEAAALSPTILRLKDGMDTTQPSTNAVSAINLFRLGALLDDKDQTAALALVAQAHETINAFEAEILQYPWLFGSLLAGVVTARLGVREYHVVAGQVDKSAIYRSPRAEARALIQFS
ncbi:hypothetical protein QBC46DRAFT_392440 [Diplogelasinospora grovesii]|uniref:Spermatogenesis-associated protein 20-like TRX domain-containing protein n=1 Tax=Diplogelasinospora grovesii TaxID=303347 RepID=A0AAN6N3A5_9PEZI|nr:hypothetical protein QBC46DRAFT_392440 [Diplogelasinospora grovesii]